MKRILFFVFLMILFQQSANSQCCTAGNPTGGDGSLYSLKKNELRINTSYRHSLSKDYFHLGSKIDVPYLDKSFYDFTNISLAYGVSERFSVFAELGYFIDKTQVSNFINDIENIRSYGLGDLSMNIKYRVFQTVKPISQFVVSGGIKFPVGVFDEELDGILIPLSLQPSSGSYKFNLSAYYSRKKQAAKFSWYTMAMYEYNSLIEREYLVYKYGDFYQFSLAANYSVLKNLSFSAIAKLEIRARDKRENNIKIESTGSSVVYLSPQIMYSFSNLWHISAFADFPIYKFVNGYQLTNKFAFQIGLRKDFILKKAD